MTRSLARLFAPRCIAIVGGGAWGAGIVGAARRIGYRGSLYLVHPSGKQMDGAQTVSALSEIAEPIDAAFVAVNRHATLEIVAELEASEHGHQEEGHRLHLEANEYW